VLRPAASNAYWSSSPEGAFPVGKRDRAPSAAALAPLAVEAGSETVAACATQGYHETAQVFDADGVIIAMVRGDSTGAYTLDSSLYI
jgi:hypothetical protein